MSDELELHPETQQLLEEIALLRDELAERLAELHSLQHTVRPNLLALFHSKLGPWELALLKAQCEAARLKRKAELVQAALNRGQSPDLVAIDGALDAEFLQWQQRMKEAAEQIESAQFRLSNLLCPAEASELKKLYYSLVKKLHPDMNSGLSSETAGLWNQVVAAYEAGDLRKLKALSLLAATAEPLVAASGIAALKAEHQKLGQHVLAALKQLAEIQAQPPFSLRRQWEDEARLASRRAELEALTAAASQHALALEKHLNALLIIHGSAKQFGHN